MTDAETRSHHADGREATDLALQPRLPLRPARGGLDPLTPRFQAYRRTPADRPLRGPRPHRHAPMQDVTPFIRHDRART